MFVRGGKSTGINAKNYIGREAYARMDEVIKPIQEQGLNALNVDFVPVEYFQSVPSNLECTCRKVQVLDRDIATPITSANPLHQTRSGAEVEIRWNTNLFGTKNETPQPENEWDGDDMSIADDDDTGNEAAIGTADQLFGTSVDCGICMHTGMVPGYNSYGRQRVLLCTHHLEATYGLTVHQNEAPNYMELLHPEAYAEYKITVPKYFKGARVACWNNRDLVSTQAGEFMTIGAQNYQATLNTFKQNAGKTVRLRVFGMKKFTHVVIDFDLGVELVHANFAQLAKSTDWQMLDTLGNINVIVPMTIGQPSNGDIIYVPNRRQAFKVTDMQYLQSARNERFDWNLTTRVLQPHETFHNLRKGGRLT